MRCRYFIKSTSHNGSHSAALSLWTTTILLFFHFVCAARCGGQHLLACGGFSFCGRARSHDGEFVNWLHVGEVRITSRQCVCWHPGAHRIATGHAHTTAILSRGDLPRRRRSMPMVKCLRPRNGRTHKRPTDRPTAAFKWWRWHNAPQVKIFSLLHPMP